jgi:hypothetical protein
MVFTFDAGTHNLVKIEKRGKKWCVYRLEKVILTDKHPRFIFENKPFESWSYKPFEDKDVKGDPETFLEDIKRWQPHLICHS